MTASVAAPSVSADQVASYRENGFLHVRAVLDADEVDRYRAAAAAAYDSLRSLDQENQMFRQIIQVWKSDPTLRELTMSPLLAGLATELTGIPLRLWHDQLLIKKPHNRTATEFHHDAPYWPHASSRRQVSAWVALVDVPVERGCMTFIPGSHRRRDQHAIDLTDSEDLFSKAPELAYQPRVTVPLRAGDCTFHDGYLAHTANANDTDEFRYAMVNIYVDAEATFTGQAHPCTDGLGLQVGQRLPDEEFPRLP